MCVSSSRSVRTRTWILALAGLSSAACVIADAQPVKGPDGDRWWAITCNRDQTVCIEKAGEVCPKGYVIGTSGGQVGMMAMTTVNGTAAITTAVPTYSGNLLVKCKAGEDPDEVQTRAEEPRPSHCDAAYRNIDDLAVLWADWYKREPVDDVPARGAFYSACGRLNEDAQMCLVPAYAKGHGDACPARLNAFAETRAKLDEILLKK